MHLAFSFCSFKYVVGSGQHAGGLVRPDPSDGVQQPTITAANGTLFNAMLSQPGARADMKLYSSKNDGQSWELARGVYPGPSAYSSLAQRSDGTIVLAYERNLQGSASRARSTRQ